MFNDVISDLNKALLFSTEDMYLSISHLEKTLCKHVHFEKKTSIYNRDMNVILFGR